MWLANDFAPVVPVNRRKIGIAGDFGFDPGDIKTTREGDGGLKELTAADDEWFGVVTSGSDGRIQVWNNDDSRWGYKLAVPTDDNRRPARQNAAERFKCLAVHGSVSADQP